ncbi:hypothetical protein D1007_51628 [Hordeum vulgare]|nr:hypothetical protein D1007_51628 [Hordeum vulgare]
MTWRTDPHPTSTTHPSPAHRSASSVRGQPNPSLSQSPSPRTPPPSRSAPPPPFQIHAVTSSPPPSSSYPWPPPWPSLTHQQNPTATTMAHDVLVLLAWHLDLIVPTLTLNVVAVGIWKYQHRPRAPAPHPCVRASMVEAPDREELDKEFDTIPSAKSPEVVR